MASYYNEIRKQKFLFVFFFETPKTTTCGSLKSSVLILASGAPGTYDSTKQTELRITKGWGLLGEVLSSYVKS